MKSFLKFVYDGFALKNKESRESKNVYYKAYGPCHGRKSLVEKNSYPGSYSEKNIKKHIYERVIRKFFIYERKNEACHHVYTAKNGNYVSEGYCQVGNIPEEMNI